MLPRHLHLILHYVLYAAENLLRALIPITLGVSVFWHVATAATDLVLCPALHDFSLMHVLRGASFLCIWLWCICLSVFVALVAVDCGTKAVRAADGFFDRFAR